MEYNVEIKEYLDALMESGIVNMYGATPLLAEEFNINKKIARKLLQHWMEDWQDE